MLEKLKKVLLNYTAENDIDNEVVSIADLEISKNYVNEFAAEIPDSDISELITVKKITSHVRSVSFSAFVVSSHKPLPDDIFDFFLGYVRDYKHQRVLEQKIKQNADNMLIGEILSMLAVKSIFNIPIENQKILCAEFGKPYLADYPDVHFNISHSGSFVACAVSNVPIGVDIQTIESYNSAIAKKVCSDGEFQQIELSDNKAAEFIRLWTRKEAYLKMLGSGFGEFNADKSNCSIYTSKLNNAFISIAVLK